jgi:hypothetical protein
MPPSLTPRTSPIKAENDIPGLPVVQKSIKPINWVIGGRLPHFTDPLKDSR